MGGGWLCGWASGRLRCLCTLLDVYDDRVSARVGGYTGEWVWGWRMDGRVPVGCA